MRANTNVTYITSCVNEVALLDKLFRSLYLQELTEPVAIIACMDGTSQGNVQWISKRHPDIEFIHNIRSQGKSVAVNIALGRVTTQYTCLIDADDVALPAKTASQLEVLQTNSEIDYCGTNYFEFGQHAVKEIARPYHIHGIENSLLFGPPFLYSSLMFDLDRMGRKPKLDERLKCAMDYQLAFDLIQKNKGVNIQTPLTAYRIRENSITRSNKRAEQLLNHSGILMKRVLDRADYKTMSIAIKSYALGLASLTRELNIFDSLWRETPEEILTYIRRTDAQSFCCRIGEAVAESDLVFRNRKAFTEALCAMVYRGLEFSNSYR